MMDTGTIAAADHGRIENWIAIPAKYQLQLIINVTIACFQRRSSHEFRYDHII
jgi:hypothetical protein